MKKYFYKTASLYGDKIITAMASYFNEFPRFINRNTIIDNTALHITWGLLRGSDFLLKKCINNKCNFLYIDHAYFNPGHKKPNPNYRLILNNFNATEIINRPENRLLPHNIEIKPWNKNGNHILICPPTETSKYFFNCHKWLENTLTELKKYTDRPIIIRLKPNETPVRLINNCLYPIKNKKSTTEIPLSEHLTNCHAVITYNSNISLDAILAGIPIVVPNLNAAYPLSTQLQKIETPEYPENRYEWLKHLAYNQFTMEEIKSGCIWNILTPN